MGAVPLGDKQWNKRAQHGEGQGKDGGEDQSRGVEESYGPLCQLRWFCSDQQLQNQTREGPRGLSDPLGQTQTSGGVSGVTDLGDRQGQMMRVPGEVSLSWERDWAALDQEAGPQQRRYQTQDTPRKHW